MVVSNSHDKRGFGLVAKFKGQDSKSGKGHFNVTKMLGPTWRGPGCVRETGPGITRAVVQSLCSG